MKNTDDVVITFGFGSTVHDNKSGNVHLIFNDTKEGIHISDFSIFPTFRFQGSIFPTIFLDFCTQGSIFPTIFRFRGPYFRQFCFLRGSYFRLCMVQ